MIEGIKTLWGREPVRAVSVVVVAAVLVYQGVRSGLDWTSAVEVALGWIAAEIARSQVTPMASPRL